MANITTERLDDLAKLTVDDGKANAMDLAFFSALDAALDDCRDARAVVITGREGMFSAGLDTKVLANLDTEGLIELLVAFGRTMLRVWGESRPIVAAATGHAVGGGTILSMCCDHAVAAAGGFRWGLIETSIGLPMPSWILSIARGNVRMDRLDDLVLPGRMVDAAAAVEVGFADDVVPGMQVIETAVEHARQLAELPADAYSYTKRQLRGRAIDSALADLESDVAAAMAGRST